MVQFAESAVKEWGFFFSERLNLLLFAPPKCGSTTILAALVEVLEPGSPYLDIESSECMPFLNVHPYARARFSPDKDAIEKAFSDNNCLKLLVIRNPFDRFASAIVSKYMVPGSPTRKELNLPRSAFASKYACGFKNSDEFVEEFVAIGKRLLAIGPVEGRRGSHVRPISSVIGPDGAAAFDYVVDVTNPQGFEQLADYLSAQASSQGLVFGGFRWLNESPVRLDAGAFPPDMVSRLNFYFKADLDAFGFESLSCPSPSPSAVAAQISAADLKGANLFYQVASRYYSQQNLISERNAKISALEIECAKNLKRVEELEFKLVATMEDAREQLVSQSLKLEQIQKERDEQAQQPQHALADAESRVTAANQACAEHAAKLKSLEGELAQLKAGREKTVVALQRVRHLARRPE